MNKTDMITTMGSSSVCVCTSAVVVTRKQTRVDIDLDYECAWCFCMVNIILADYNAGACYNKVTNATISHCMHVK